MKTIRVIRHIEGWIEHNYQVPDDFDDEQVIAHAAEDDEYDITDMEWETTELTVVS